MIAAKAARRSPGFKRPHAAAGAWQRKARKCQRILRYFRLPSSFGIRSLQKINQVCQAYVTCLSAVSMLVGLNIAPGSGNAVMFIGQRAPSQRIHWWSSGSCASSTRQRM